MTRDTEVDPHDLAGQEATAAATAAEERRQAQVAISDFQWLMKQRQFRRFMWGLLMETHALESIAPSDAMQMSFLEGVRSVGVSRLRSILNLCPERLIEMQKENLSNG